MRQMLSVLLVAGLCASSALAQFDYLREMPTVAAVKAAFDDPDPMQRAGKQIAALVELQEIGRTFVGRFDALAKPERLKPAERQLFASYQSAIRDIRATPGLDGDEASNLAMRIGMSVRSDLTQRFFSSGFVAELNRAQVKFDEHLRQVRAEDDRAEQRTLPATRPATGTDGNLSFGDIVVLWFWKLVYLGGAVVAFLLWRKFRFNEKTEVASNSKREMDRLGASVDARSKKIEQMFTQKSDSLTFDLRTKTKQRTWVTAKMTRSIAAMPTREREMVRGLYHLFNIGACSAENFYWGRLALIYSEGKAQVTEHNFIRPGSVTDFQTALKELTGMTAESTVSVVLDLIGRAAMKNPDHPVIKQLSERLFGGGEASLSSAGSFAAAQGGKTPALVLGLADDTGAPITYAGEGSVITIAPPRAGKSQSQVFPTLLTWNGPAVVLDIKGEIYDGTSKWRGEHVGPVYRFAPLDPANSSRYNPLAAVRTDAEFVWEDSRFLADMMIVPTESKDQFWQERARDVLTATIARACLAADPNQRSIGAVLDVFHGVGWDEFIADLRARSDIRSMLRAGTSLGEMDRKTRDGVLQTGLTSLSAWDGERIERSTKSSDWSPSDLRSGENPTIYICLGAAEVKSYVSILRVLIAQHIRSLTASMPPRNAMPILFMLDELPQLRHMPPIEEALNVGAGFGIRLWMFTQSVGQMKEVYPNADGMIGACAVRTYMNPSLHDGTAQKLSEDIGFQEGVLDGQRQKIVEAALLAGPDYKEHVIVMASGFKPFRLRKNYAYQDAQLSARMGRQ